MSLPLAAAADRAMAQRLPRLAALLNRCPGSLFERSLKKVDDDVKSRWEVWRLIDIDSIWLDWIHWITCLWCIQRIPPECLRLITDTWRYQPKLSAARITVPSEVASLELATEAELLTETPEMVDAPITGEAPFTEGAVEGPNLATLTPGVNVMTGMAIGALHRLMAPELEALVQQSPTGPARLVPIMSSAVIMGLGALLARSQPVQGLTQVLNGVLQHVPFLGGQNWLAQSVQLMVGSQIGQMIGQHLRPQDAAPEAASAVPSVPSVFLSEMCVLCHNLLCIICARGSEWQPWIVAMHAFVLRTGCVHLDGLWPLQIFSSFTIASRILEVLWNARFLLSLNSWRFRLLHHPCNEPKKTPHDPKSSSLEPRF